LNKKGWNQSKWYAHNVRLKKQGPKMSRRRVGMVQRYLDRLVAVAALAAVMSGCLTPLSKADAEGTNDAAAKKKVEQFLGAGLPGKATVHFVDLNGDGVPEALVISNDQQDCGTRGCAANVLDLRGPAAKDIGDFIAFDLQPLSSKTRGWRDISVIGSRNSGRARFNGRVYSISSPAAGGSPNSAAIVPAAAPSSKVSSVGEWTSVLTPQAVTISTPEGKDPFQIVFSCQTSQSAMRVTIYTEKYRGSIPEKVESELPFVLEVQRASGGSSKFPVSLRYTPADGGAWLGGGVTTAFFDDFAHDGKLIWRTGGGTEITSWPLKGSSEARESVRTECNL
jgi:hypothetical protein